ncbi:MAG TPA: aspartate kinase [Bacteroidia bacterium]|jgi:aspartate kinase|nr:aspartate kinase [Bacteroidia bacterium]
MKVFKFGGASVKDAAAVKNAASIVKLYPGELIIVVSAMGKTTNNLERLMDAFFYKKENAEKVLEEIKQFHLSILKDLFPNPSHTIYTQIENDFVELHWAIEDEPTYSYNHEYDQVVCMGEIISSRILAAYLAEAGIPSTWVDARNIIQTDNTYREGNVDFELSQQLAQKELLPLLKQHKVIVTQGFLGGTSENFTTTLGREGSDYTAAILAYCCGAEDVTIWKDVPGVLNADPKWFNNTQKIDELTYQDAIELAYYGATVIHPKTIKPLQNKNIPLYVRSFVKPDAEGTIIKNINKHLPIPSFIFKVSQILLTISPRDFSFIAEDNLSKIFALFHQHGIKTHVMQLSAISFSVCADMDEKKIEPLVAELQKEYKVLYNDNLELVTIRYYDQSTIDRVCINKQILLEQKSRYTVQLVVRNIE